MYTNVLTYTPLIMKQRQSDTPPVNITCLHLTGPPQHVQHSVVLRNCIDTRLYTKQLYHGWQLYVSSDVTQWATACEGQQLIIDTKLAVHKIFN